MQYIINRNFEAGSYEIKKNTPIYYPTFWKIEFTDITPNRIDRFSNHGGGLEIHLGEGGNLPLSISQKIELLENKRYTLTIAYKFDFFSRDYFDMNYAFKIFVGNKLMNDNLTNGIEDYHPQTEEVQTRQYSFELFKNTEINLKLVIDTMTGNTGRLYIYEVILTDD